jgi:hypothetical protein
MEIYLKTKKSYITIDYDSQRLEKNERISIDVDFFDGDIIEIDKKTVLCSNEMFTHKYGAISEIKNLNNRLSVQIYEDNKSKFDSFVTYSHSDFVIKLKLNSESYNELKNKLEKKIKIAEIMILFEDNNFEQIEGIFSKMKKITDFSITFELFNTN